MATDLIEAAKNLLEQCYQADALEELPANITGELMDAVRDGLIAASPAPPATDPVKLSDAERKLLAEALYVSALNCKVATDFLPFAQISEDRQKHWRREVGGMVPHIECILTARQAAQPVPNDAAGAALLELAESKCQEILESRDPDDVKGIAAANLCGMEILGLSSSATEALAAHVQPLVALIIELEVAFSGANTLRWGLDEDKWPSPARELIPKIRALLARYTTLALTQEGRREGEAK